LLRRCTAAWLDPEAVRTLALKSLEQPPPPPTSPRINIAHHLVKQVRLGLAFGVYDNIMEARFLRRWGPELDPHNSFIGKRLVLARMKVVEQPKIPGHAPTLLLPRNNGASSLEQAIMSLMHPSQDNHAPTAAVRLYAAILRCREGALRIDNGSAVDVLALEIANYVECLRRLSQYQWELEMEIRSELGLPLTTPVKLGSLQRPLPAFLDWIEALLGYKIICEPAQRPTVTLRNHLNQETVPIFGSVTPGPAAITAAS